MANAFGNLNAETAKQWVEKLEAQLRKAQERVGSARTRLLAAQERWRIKATYLAREALRYALIEGPQARAREAEEAAETVAEESASGDEG